MNYFIYRSFFKPSRSEGTCASTCRAKLETALSRRRSRSPRVRAPEVLSRRDTFCSSDGVSHSACLEIMADISVESAGVLEGTRSMAIAVVACLEPVPERAQEYMPTTGGKNNSEGPLQHSLHLASACRVPLFSRRG